MIYRICVFGGVIAGVSIATPFASRVDLTPPLWIAVAVLAICVALALAAITKVLFAHETFSFLHYQIASIAVTALVLPQALDLLALALAITQAVGRIGCLRAGCCHGRPSRFGIRYRDEVAPHWSGARVLPVQALESIALVVIAIVTARAIGNGALLVYALSYACVRFATELLRGDRRRHFLRLSEAQWICVATSIHAGTLWLAALAFVVACIPRRDYDALAQAIHRARNAGGIAGAQDVHISYGVSETVEHYTLSVAGRDARTIARLVRDLVHPDARVTLLPGNRGTFHLLIGDAP
jgi:prolipoprotein diacylglyceryltransferase